MKVTVLKIRSFIFILLFITGLSLIVPLHRKIVSAAEKLVEDFSSQVYEKTGLHFTYKSLSPSILSTLNVRSIYLSDDSGVDVLFIKKAFINYKLFRLLKGDFSEGFTNIVIDGISLDLDALVRLKEHFSTENEKKIPAKNGKNRSRELDFESINNMIPKNVSLKNISLIYDYGGFAATLFVRNFNFYPSSAKNGVNFELTSRLKLVISKISQTFTMNAAFSGSYFPGGQGSFVNMRLLNISNGEYSLRRLNFLVSYDNNKLESRIIQAENPISFGADFNLETKDLNIQLKTQELYPLQTLKSSAYRTKLKDFSDFNFTTDSILKYNLEDKSLDYISDTSMNIPDKLFSGGAKVDFSLYGDENHLEMTDFTAEGKRILSNLNFDYVFKDSRLSGLFALPYLILENGNTVSTEIYFDPLEKGFVGFSPQIFVGDSFLSAMQLKLIPQSDSYYYDFEVSDFSHSDSFEAGLLRIDGNILPSSKYAELNVNLQSIFADSIMKISSSFMEKSSGEKMQTLSSKLSSIMLSGDLYFSTDLKSLSYNVPYIIGVNTSKENQSILLSAGGNEQSLQINRLSAVFGKFDFTASASLDKNVDGDDFFFVLDLNSSSIPYHFSGNLMKDYISLSGDYDSDLNIHFYDDSRLSGNFVCKNLPLVYDSLTSVLSMDSVFNYTRDNGPEILLKAFEVEAAGANYTVSPKIVLAGSITRYGAHFDTLGYSDIYSMLSGQSDLAFELNDGIFNSVTMNASLTNPYDEESLTFDFNVTNPEMKAFSLESLTNSIYMNLSMQLMNFNLNHFVPGRNENNYVTGSLFATGTLNHPYVTLNLDTLSFSSGGKVRKVRGSLLLEDRILSVPEINMTSGNTELSKLKGDFYLDSMSGKLDGKMSSYVGGKSLSAPFTLEMNNSTVPQGKFFPDSFMLTLSSNLSGEFIKKPFAFTASLMYSQGDISFFTSDNAGIYGLLTKDRDLQASWNNGFASMKIEGSAAKKLNLSISDVDLDLYSALSYFDFDRFFIAQKGHLLGEAKITGSSNDPDISGNMIINEPELIFSLISAQKLQAPLAPITIANSEIRIDETVFSIKKTEKILGTASIFLNRFSFDHLEASLKSINDEKFPGKLKTKFFVIKSDVNIDLDLFYENGILDVDGTVIGENTSFTADVQKFMASSNSKPGKLNFRTDLQIQLGNHATFILDPLLRAVLVPYSRLGVTVDSSDSSYIVDGNVGIRSGDIAYLNRNFYIKSGRIKFNADDLLNPLVTVKAETRERDSKGKSVKIALTAENQYLRELSPRFSAEPSKSENEIRTILGQIAVADSSSDSSMSGANILFAAGDYAIQSSVGRKIENSLRELLNFDIFSVRTNVLQNTLNYGFTRNSSSSKEVFTIGNLLDNSTVYMGKYLGSSLYVDTMFHVSLEDSVQSYDELTASDTLNLNFQPEFGLELESPFVNIRWSVSPDIKALLNQQFKPSSALTLSWNFQF